MAADENRMHAIRAVTVATWGAVMKVVVALGGNALLERGEPPDSSIQESHIARAAAALSPLLRDHDLIITHGNGPQVGMLALESGGDPSLTHPYPFDVLGAQTQGMIGYWLVQALDRAAAHDAGRRGVLEHGAAHGERWAKPAVCLVCRTLVKADDPAFDEPSKFVGPVYDQATASRLAAGHGWEIRRDGQAWRRVVPSPEPAALVELDTIRLLAGHGFTVICAGGGGVPVVADGEGGLRGVEAVVDKDLTAALLAEEVGADVLLLLTDVPAVLDGYGTEYARPIGQVTPAQLRRRLQAGVFPAGSMGPKVEAACRFAAATGGLAAIGRLDDAEALLEGRAGTIVQQRTVRAGAP
jgi:carbamate kinase